MPLKRPIEFEAFETYVAQEIIGEGGAAVYKIRQDGKILWTPSGQPRLVVSRMRLTHRNIPI